MSVPIPQPPALPILGNVTDVDPRNSIESLKILAQKYGPIFKLNFLGKEQYFATTVELINELCNEKRFHKAVTGGLEILRTGAGDGLFTAYHGEHNWDIAHRVLVPAFGPLGIRNMFDEMKDIGVQLVQKWARTTDRINVTDDYTRLTLDTIALAAMDMRFNSFYSEKMHPFVDAMVSWLVESSIRESKTKLELALRRSKAHKFEQDINLMRKICKEVVDHRKAHPVEKKDLLNAMLYGKDLKTGEGLTDESIINNMLTFLIAGHETTSGLLSFATYYLLKNPAVLEKAQAEVDEVVGDRSVNFEHMSKLPYLEAVLRETLRLQPTAPAFTVETHGAPEIIGGKYLIPPGKPVHCLLPVSGRDPAAYGADANQFRPERMVGDGFTSLPPGAWKPFGNGARGCIGRPFAWQEALLALALILQNFDLRLDDPSYSLRIKESLTLKPDSFYMRAKLRNGINPMKLEQKIFTGAAEMQDQQPSEKSGRSNTGPKKPVTVLYGSNSGTCEGLAHAFASNATAYGYEAIPQPLDNFVNQLPKEQPVVMITASYEGEAPDNATSFIQWIQNNSTKLEGLQYAVFGCGHHDWVSTYQKIPRLIDTQFERKGGIRIAERGESDVANGTVFNDFDKWQDDVFWPKLAGTKTGRTEDMLDVQISTTTRGSHLNYYVQDALVLSNTALTPEGLPEKRHVELRLPTSITYQAGDYMAILPMNSNAAVARVLRHFNLPWDAVMTLKGSLHSWIPKDKELPLTTVLRSYVELGKPATRKNLSTIAVFKSNTTDCNSDMPELSQDANRSPSVLDILEANPDYKVPFSAFLSMLTPMRVRWYSISSSPLQDSNVASITFSLANEDHVHPGVATNYLKTVEPGSKVNIMIKKSHAAFHPPLDEKTPILMACAGTGIAPFRGFVQERVAKIENGKTELGQALLFIGCRDPNTDMLFADDFRKAEELGAVKIFYAFSRAPSQSEGCKYVQDRIWRERELVKELFDQGAQAYVCGSSAVGMGITEVVTKMVIEANASEGKTCTREEALVWWEELRNERYAVDVFD